MCCVHTLTHVVGGQMLGITVVVPRTLPMNQFHSIPPLFYLWNGIYFHPSICCSTAEEDYRHLEERIEFGIEDLEMRRMVLIVDNDVLENMELFTATIVPIRGPFPVAVQNDNVTVIITDNDCELISAS